MSSNDVSPYEDSEEKEVLKGAEEEREVVRGEEDRDERGEDSKRGELIVSSLIFTSSRGEDWGEAGVGEDIDGEETGEEGREDSRLTRLAS